MANDTGVDYDYKDIIMPQNEEVVFLRNYGMALERSTNELRVAVSNASDFYFTHTIKNNYWS